MEFIIEKKERARNRGRRKKNMRHGTVLTNNMNKNDTRNQEDSKEIQTNQDMRRRIKESGF